MKESSKRIVWIDRLKGFFLFFIVMSHQHVPESLSFIISPTAMYYVPIFFVLSGYLHKKKGIKEYFIKKTRTLLVPYVFFSLLFLLLDWKTYFYDGYMGGGIFRIFIKGIGSEMSSPLWFVFLLYITTCSFNYIVNQSKDIRNVIAIIIVAVCFSYIFSYYSVILPFQLHILMPAIVFYGFGYIIKRIDVSGLNVYILIFLLIGGVMGMFCNLGDFHKNEINDIALFYLSPLSFSMAIIAVTQKYNSGKHTEALCWIAKNGIVILAVHVFIIWTFTKMRDFFFPNIDSMSVFFIECSYLWVVLYLMCPILSNKLRFILGK